MPICSKLHSLVHFLTSYFQAYIKKYIIIKFDKNILFIFTAVVGATGSKNGKLHNLSFYSYIPFLFELICLAWGRSDNVIALYSKMLIAIVIYSIFRTNRNFGCHACELIVVTFHLQPGVNHWLILRLRKKQQNLAACKSNIDIWFFFGLL